MSDTPRTTFKACVVSQHNEYLINHHKLQYCRNVSISAMKLSSFLLLLVPSLATAFSVAPLALPKTSSTALSSWGSTGDFGADRYLRDERYQRDDRYPSLSDSHYRDNNDMSRRASFGSGSHEWDRRRGSMMNRGGRWGARGGEYDRDWDDDRRYGGRNSHRYNDYDYRDEGRGLNRGNSWNRRGISSSARDYDSYENDPSYYSGRRYLDGQYDDGYGYGRRSGMGRNQWGRQERNHNSMMQNGNSPYSGAYNRNYNTHNRNYNSYDRDYSNFGRGNDRRLASRSSFQRY